MARGGLEPLNGIRGQRALEEVDEARMFQLRSRDRLGRVRQRCEPESGRAEAAQGLADLRMGRKTPNGAEDGLAVGIGHFASVAPGDHFERGSSHRPEIDIRVRDGRYQRGLEKLGEPLLAHACLTEDPVERPVQGFEVEERLVDIEDADAFHGTSPRWVT